MPDSIAVSIAGASGYSGLELTRLLLRHPLVRLEKLFANTSAGRKIADVSPWFRGRLEGSYEEYSPEAACTSDVVFLALPSGEAMNLVPELLRRGKRVIDLGGDFRLRDISVYEQYYKRPHKAVDLVSKAIYGLPEWNGALIRSASLIANPGCYPTSAILPLAPLLRDGCIKAQGISINSLSGVSGAGRSASVDYSFVEVNETVRAYKVGTHQHMPEISTTLESIAGKEVSLLFIPHLIPVTKGILTTITANLREGAAGDDLFAAYSKAYGHAPFVRILKGSFPELKNVNGSNYIEIGFHVDAQQQRVIIISAIDNLVKGAAGQAIQNMNLMFGFNETEGLL